jgi:hypothetical protein
LRRLSPFQANIGLRTGDAHGHFPLLVWKKNTEQSLDAARSAMLTHFPHATLAVRRRRCPLAFVDVVVHDNVARDDDKGARRLQLRGGVCTHRLSLGDSRSKQNPT